MAIQEDSIKMAEELKQIILDFPDLRSLTQKVFEWTKLKKYLKHNCEQSDLTAVGHTLHRGKFSCGVDCPLLSGTFKCKFCNFEEKVTLRANGSIESKTRYSKTDESPLEMATGGKDTSNSVLNSTSSKKKSNFYTFKIDSQPILDSEYPMKYWEDKERIHQFQKKFSQC